MEFETFSNDVTNEGAILRTTVARFSRYNKELPHLFELLYIKLEPRRREGKYAIAVLNSFKKKIGYIPIQFGSNLIELLVNSFKNNLPIEVSVVGVDAKTIMTVTIELVFYAKAGFAKKAFKKQFKVPLSKGNSNQLSLF